MVRGILADYNVRGQVNYLLTLMRTQPWVEFWEDLRLVALHFEDVGLVPEATWKSGCGARLRGSS